MTDNDSTTSDEYALLIVTPVFNDWQCLNLLLPRLDAVLDAYPHVSTTTILVVDDASNVQEDIPFSLADAKNISTIKTLRHHRNLGHQRAIGIGLTYAQANIECDVVVVMDADGEDTPEDVPRLLDEVRNTAEEKIVFAERIRRSESIVFKFFYHLYRFVHLILTGISVRVGNFSAIPSKYLSNFSVISETWSHYAAAIYTTSLPRTSIPIARGNRLAGNPKMNFTALVTHGLSALAVHGAVIGVRMLISTSVVSAIALVITFLLFFLWLVQGYSDLQMYCLLAFFTSLTLCTITLFTLGLNLLILNNRTQLGYLPGRDYTHFIDHVRDHHES
jgi:glycosyltransferase involved in cell wall biosynthesis